MEFTKEVSPNPLRKDALPMSTHASRLQSKIEELWVLRDNLSSGSDDSQKRPIQEALRMMSNGTMRVAQRQEDGSWEVSQWPKQAVLLYFRINESTVINSGADVQFFDKVPSKFKGWSKAAFVDSGIRVVPNAVARHGSFIGENVVLMSASLVNIGAYVGDGCMVDTGASVGTCAQVGRNVHIGAHSGIGGVIEPLQAQPTIIEDNVFIGAQSEVVEGVIVREGAVLSMGVYIGASTPIYDITTGKWLPEGEIPADAVVLPGSRSTPDDWYSGVTTYCVVIKKYADLKTREKVGINELLRD